MRLIQMMTPLILTALVLTLGACQSSPGGGGAATIPVTTQAAQEVGQDQGSAQASETVSSTNTVTPTVFNILGAKHTRIAIGADGTTVEAEGSDGGEITVGDANMGVQFGDEGQRAESHSGGGAAGGTGGATRTARDRRGSAASGTGDADGGGGGD